MWAAADGAAGEGTELSRRFSMVMRHKNRRRTVRSFGLRVWAGSPMERMDES